MREKKRLLRDKAKTRETERIVMKTKRDRERRKRGEKRERER